MRVRVRVITLIWNYRNSILYFLCNKVTYYQHYIPVFCNPGNRGH